ncbi:hypothetical protein DVH05_014089 [Phytophthora capsici]|nr:hypothetical protein DVH05_014089 [Phytophthora capsici]
MRVTQTLLAIAVVLFASSDNLTTASKATTSSKVQKDGLYAEIYNIEDGVVTKKMRVPLGDVEQYSDTDFEQLKSTLTTEERAAVHLPFGVDSFFKGLGGFRIAKPVWHLRRYEKVFLSK